MTKIEVKDYGFRTLLTIWTGTDRGQQQPLLSI